MLNTEDSGAQAEQESWITIHGDFSRVLTLAPSPELLELLERAGLINSESGEKVHPDFPESLVRRWGGV
jgi:hypothetical protein